MMERRNSDAEVRQERKDKLFTWKFAQTFFLILSVSSTLILFTFPLKEPWRDIGQVFIFVAAFFVLISRFLLNYLSNESKSTSSTTATSQSNDDEVNPKDETQSVSKDKSGEGYKSRDTTAIDVKQLKAIRSGLNSLNYRLTEEVTRLEKGADVNLIIGILVSAIALGSLGFVVFMNPSEYKGYADFLFRFVPRLSFVIFIELLSFFFLKIYKSLLDDIKYFKNEQTNVEFKIIAIETAFYKSDKKLIEKVVEEFLRTERNFKLGQGESTVQLENTRLTTENNKLLTDFLSKVSEKIFK